MAELHISNDHITDFLQLKFRALDTSTKARNTNSFENVASFIYILFIVVVVIHQISGSNHISKNRHIYVITNKQDIRRICHEYRRLLAAS